MEVNRRRSQRGITLVELLIAIIVCSLTIVLGINGFKVFRSRTGILDSVRTATSALSTARYLAIEKNKSIKVELRRDKIHLLEMKQDQWVSFKDFEFDEKTAVSMNASPVFSPTGSVAPLCTIYLENDRYTYKITISIAGRIKTIRVEN